MSDIKSLREKIDQLDAQLVDLLWERFVVVEEIGRLKKLHGEEILQTQRWKEVLDAVQSRGKEKHIPPGCIEKIWNAIHETALDKEHRI